MTVNMGNYMIIWESIRFSRGRLFYEVC